MKVNEKKRQLRLAGCYKVREGANHEVWFSPKTGNQFPISRHDNKELPTGTAKIIDKQAGLA